MFKTNLESSINNPPSSRFFSTKALVLLSQNHDTPSFLWPWHNLWTNLYSLLKRNFFYRIASRSLGIELGSRKWKKQWKLMSDFCNVLHSFFGITHKELSQSPICNFLLFLSVKGLFWFEGNTKSDQKYYLVGKNILILILQRPKRYLSDKHPYLFCVPPNFTWFIKCQHQKVCYIPSDTHSHTHTYTTHTLSLSLSLSQYMHAQTHKTTFYGQQCDICLCVKCQQASFMRCSWDGCQLRNPG